MIPEKMLELLILAKISDNYFNDELYSISLDNSYDIQKLRDRYDELEKEFLNDYALNKTEKSD